MQEALAELNAALKQQVQRSVRETAASPYLVKEDTEEDTDIYGRIRIETIECLDDRMLT